MRSKAHFKSHPLHPILIPFPIAFFTGTFVFDVLGFMQDNEDFRRTAMYLEIAGIVMALIAAVPGIIDYFFTVPPDSSAKKRATQHGLTNISMVVVFAIALYLRDQNTTPLVVIGLEALGVVLLVIAGWMGGTLVYRNQIGVDPRYAHAGKWKEEYLESKESPVQVAVVDELKENQMKLVHIDGKRIVIGRTEKGYVAFDDHCTHRGGSLAGGAMMCGTVQCPWHGSQFDVHTGTVTAGPAKEAISVYKLSERDGAVYLSL